MYRETPSDTTLEVSVSCFVFFEALRICVKVITTDNMFGFAQLTVLTIENDRFNIEFI